MEQNITFGKNQMGLFGMIDTDLEITRALQQHSCMQCSSLSQKKEVMSYDWVWKRSVKPTPPPRSSVGPLNKQRTKCNCFFYLE